MDIFDETTTEKKSEKKSRKRNIFDEMADPHAKIRYVITTVVVETEPEKVTNTKVFKHFISLHNFNVFLKFSYKFD